jgi:hypothetical protein
VATWGAEAAVGGDLTAQNCALAQICFFRGLFDNSTCDHILDAAKFVHDF